MIETNESDLAKREVLSYCKNFDKNWYLIALYSERFSLVKLNYNIHNKGTVVIVYYFKEWRHMVGCHTNTVVVYSLRW